MFSTTRSMVLAVAGAVVLATGCAGPQDLTVGKYADGQIRPPENYRSWTKKFDAIQRPEIKQVREVYVNPIGETAKAGEPLPNGYVSVMELWSVVSNSDTRPKTDADGKLIKDKLLKVFVMAKGEGWGESVKPAQLRNGDWVYSAWMSNGSTRAPDLAASCRGCHLAFADKDFMPRYDEAYNKAAAAHVHVH